ncbi:hypothetical protein OPW32_19785 [Vibrio europaeus]|uniref:hypothetical protein n=1 Tax=Vibrio europaeus TaxID=300876 RepID=UPI0023412E89|nr:hypothetical protein [Vibrio europaeus]MDC5851431.1 hypothetical protein [Vibrio europaeus]
MEEILLGFDERISELTDMVISLQNIIGDQPISKQLRDSFANFNKSCSHYKLASNEDDLDKLSESAKMVAVYGQATGQAVNAAKMNDEINESANRLLRYANEFRSFIEDSPLMNYSLSENDRIERTDQVKNFRSVRNQLEQISNSHLIFDERIKKLLAEGEQRALKLEEKLKNIEDDYEGKLNSLSTIYDQSLQNIKDKNTQLNEVLGEVSSRVIAQDYEKSAENEMGAANLLRYASIFCMFLIVAVVGYAFWESTQSEFDLQSSGFRLVLAFLLSVPAAYLARESTKHRLQQYAHLQTALDLKAISPYLASLPEVEQHKIKSEMANRIFASRDTTMHSPESYPINANELVVELLKKVEFSRNK